MPAPVALIAEDEPVLAEALRRQLKRLWPDLAVPAMASDGLQAVSMALKALPDILFLDIHMPGATGLEVAERVIEEWPSDQPLPLVAFITAYDTYAVAAFDRAAIDYVLKPVRPERLAMTCLRLQSQLATRQEAPLEDPLPASLLDLRHAEMAQQMATASTEPLRVLQAASGTSIYVVPVEDIVYLEAADKYMRIVSLSDADAGATAGREKLIRTPLRELLPRLDPSVFWQIHRSHVVNVRAIERVSRQHNRTRVHLRGRAETLDVSRMYAHLFKAM